MVYPENKVILRRTRNFAEQQATFGPLIEWFQGFVTCRYYGTLSSRGIRFYVSILTCVLIHPSHQNVHVMQVRVLLPVRVMSLVVACLLIFRLLRMDCMSRLFSNPFGVYKTDWSYRLGESDLCFVKYFFHSF